jgi:iron complex outermembrane receptor protein
MYNSLIVFSLLCSSFLMTISVPAETDDTSVPKRELLLLQEVPVVVTPSKVAQPSLESPSTISVLTRDDIRRYGMTSFSDILRNVPGVDVMSVSPTDRNISMRGFNHLTAGKILSLVDNRPIYLDLYGMTLWEFLPVSIDDIERIEIVRGPGSALYGANAFDGVVNIITDSAPAHFDTRMTATVNQLGRLSGSIAHGGGLSALTYRAFAGWNRMSGWDDEKSDAGENRRFNGHLHYAIDDRSSLRLSGGVKNYRGDFLIGSEFDPTKYGGTAGYLETDYARSELKCRIFWRRVAWNIESQKAFSAYRIETDVFDADLQHSFRPLGSNSITWGVNYRFNWVDSEMLGGQHSQNLMAGYIQNQTRLSRALTLTTGLRYDRHPLTGNNLSPRGSIVYSPAIGHAFRASVGRAFQNPSFLYSYFSMSYKMLMPMSPASVDVKVLGNEELSPEWITSFELGYRGVFGTRLRGSVDVFFNKLDGLIMFDVAETYAESELFPGSPGGVVPAVMSMFNNHDADACGGEITADILMTRWLSAYVNYSYQRVADSETGERIQSAPLHKLNPGLCIKSRRGFLVNVFANYVDRTVWDDVEIEPYVMLNSALSYRIGSVKAGLSVFNLLNDRHLEHPQGDEIGRFMVLSLMYQIY